MVSDNLGSEVDRFLSQTLGKSFPVIVGSQLPLGTTKYFLRVMAIL